MHGIAVKIHEPPPSGIFNPDTFGLGNGRSTGRRQRLMQERVCVTAQQIAGFGVGRARRPFGACGRRVSLAFGVGRRAHQLRGFDCGATIQFGQGKEYVLTLVKNFIASVTPSLTALPLSLMPPKGDVSMR